MEVFQNDFRQLEYHADACDDDDVKIGCFCHRYDERRGGKRWAMWCEFKMVGKYPILQDERRRLLILNLLCPSLTLFHGGKFQWSRRRECVPPARLQHWTSYQVGWLDYAAGINEQPISFGKDF